MEKYVLGYFREQLSKIIIGFREEQVNANLLNGKGEIRDLQINCSVLNKLVSQLVPFATFDEVHVSKLGFQVTSWANIRKAPIVVNIGCITAVMAEPLNFVSVKKSGVRMMTEKELARMIEEGLVKPFRKLGAYGTVDRITDNLTIEIEKINISFATMGKFKTKRAGSWTPPVLHIECRNFRSTAVDIHGHEGTPEQIWAHNHRQNQYFLLCRKVALETTIRLKSSEKEITLLKDLKLEVQLAIKQRLRDGHLLGVQADVTIPSVDVMLEQEDLPMVASLVAGLQYCVVKDRSFEDPLHSKSEEGDPSKQKALASVISSSKSNNVNNGIEGGVADGPSEPVDNISVGSDSSYDGDEGSASDAPQENAGLATNSSTSDVRERPVLKLPLGIIIYEDVCITVSVHQAVIMGAYTNGSEDGVQLTARGTITELIWPKVNSEFGFHAQASVSYCTIEERFDNHRSSLLIVGMAREDHTSLGRKPAKPPEVNFDESFPFFEKRSIRNDPLDLRRTFPCQGFGQKVSVDFLNKDMASPKIYNETGVNQVEVVADLEPWWRVARYALNEAGGGYDPRIHSGDWSDVLTVDMLQDPTKPIDLDEQLQFTRQKFLGEDYMISSDVFNALLRFTNIVIRIPAGIKESIRACDVVMKLKEATVTVTSDLPRTFLTGKLSGRKRRDDQSDKNTVDFPNDPSDILFHIESEGDSPSKRQALPASNKSSTFRQHITVRGFQMMVIPIVPYCSAVDPRQLLEPTDVTLIASSEGETPSPGDEPTKLIFFLSIHLHTVLMNLDLDLLAGMTSTLLYHSDTVVDALKALKALSSTTENKTKVQNQKIVKKSMKGRQEMLRRQVLRSKATSGLTAVVCLELSEFGLSLWRQNIPTESPVLSIDSVNSGRSLGENTIAALKLLDIRMDNFEAGGEFGFRNENISHTVLKCCLDHAAIEVCSLRDAIKKGGPTFHLEAQTFNENRVDLLSFGAKPVEDATGTPLKDCQQIAFRCEELRCDDTKTWSVAAKVTSPATLNLYFDEIKDCVAMCIEALMMPSWSKRHAREVVNAIFPPRSLGAFFHSLIAQMESIGGKSRDLGIDFGEDFKVPAAERMMKKVFEEFLPKLDMILCRCELANLLIQAPVDAQGSKRIGILMNQSDLSARLCRSRESLASEIVEVLSCEESGWSSMLQPESSDLFLGFMSLSSLVGNNADGTRNGVEVLVQPSGVNISYSEGRFDLAMSDTLHIGDVRLIEAQVLHIKEIATNCKSQILDLMAQLSTLKTHSNLMTKGNEVNVQETERVVDPNSVRNSRSLLDKLHLELLEYEQSVRVELRKKDLKLARLQKELFLKERERFSAVSLLGSRVAGWIRMGGVHLVGQRVNRKTTMLPYWTILRKNLLLLFSAPGELGPLDAVQLEGAKIRGIGGAGVKRGFAIIESDGTTRFFVCESASDYMFWMNDLSAAVLACNGSIDDETTDESSGGNADKGPGYSDAMEAEAPGLREKINLSNRLTGAKSKFGSAMMTSWQKGKEMSDTARQKGREISGQARQKGREMSDRFEGSSKGSIGSADMLESFNPEDSRGASAGNNNGGERNDGRGRFGRFGSASLAGLRNKISAPARVLQIDKRPLEVEVVRHEESTWTDPSFTPSNTVETPADEDSPSSPLIDLMSPNDTLAASNSGPLSPVEELQEGNSNESPGDANRVGFLGIGAGGQKPEGANLQGRLNFRKKNSDISDKYAPVTMRDIFARGQAPSLPDQELAWEILKSFEGHCIVSVVPEPVDSNIASLNLAEEAKEVVPEDISEQGSDTELKPSSALGDGLSEFFRIKVRQVDKSHKESSSEKLCRLGDIFELYTQFSEDIQRVAAQLLQVDQSNTQIAVEDRRNMVDKLLVGGMMLGGILDMDEGSTVLKKTRDYQADVLGVFLNSVLECPMPVGTLTILIEVLGIDVETKSVGEDPTNTETNSHKIDDESQEKVEKDVVDTIASESPLQPEKMLSLISACGVQMLRAEQVVPRTAKVQPEVKKESFITPDRSPVGNSATFGSPLLPASVQEQLQGSVHDALIGIMAERDMANAVVVGSKVLHMHELEHEKRRNRLLELELAILRQISATTSGALFRGQQATVTPYKDLEVKVRKLQHENSDDMMIALSQQLGVEIHAKTEYEAEIKRMKESEKLKTENESAENEALKSELKRMKDLLAAEERSKEEATKEAEVWKTSYERLNAVHGDD